MIRDILQFPIPEIKTREKGELSKQVDSIMEFNQELNAAKLESKKDQLKSRIEHCEEKINQLVYSLYNLTNNEIAIVEEVK